MASTVVIKDGLHTGANPATPTVGVVTAEEARASNAAGWARATTGVGARTGVAYHGITALLTATATSAPSMTVAVGPLVIVGQKAASEGVYVPTSPGTVILDIAVAPGANSRIDVVYGMQRDAGSATAPDGLTQAELGVVTGTAGVSPAKPAIPVGAVEVGTVTVAAGSTSTTSAGVTVATTCRWTVPLGVPIPVRDVSERAALTGYPGLMVTRLDAGGALERWSGSAWTRDAIPVIVALDAPLLGSYDATKPVKIWTVKRAVATDNNSDAIILSAAAIGSGCVLSANIAGGDVYEILTACRGLSGNLVARIWSNGTAFANGSVTITGTIIGQ